MVDRFPRFQEHSKRVPFSCELTNEAWKSVSNQTNIFSVVAGGDEKLQFEETLKDNQIF